MSRRSSPRRPPSPPGDRRPRAGLAVHRSRSATDSAASPPTIEAGRAEIAAPPPMGSDGHAEAGSGQGLQPGTARAVRPTPRAEHAAGASGSPGAERKGGTMPTEAKRAMVAELTEVFTSNRSSIVADPRGLKVSEISAVRRALREQGISYRVVKNRLA